MGKFTIHIDREELDIEDAWCMFRLICGDDALGVLLTREKMVELAHALLDAAVIGRSRTVEEV